MEEESTISDVILLMDIIKRIERLHDKPNKMVMQFLKTYKNLSESFYVELVKHNANYIKFFRNPTEDMQLMAVMHDAELVLHIKKPTKRVQQYVQDFLGGCTTRCTQ